MAILRELWSGEALDENVLSTYQYVIELRDRLEQTCKLAHENFKKVQIKQKAYYDALGHVSLTLEIRFYYYCRLTVINCYCSGKVHMKLLRWLIGWTIR